MVTLWVSQWAIRKEGHMCEVIYLASICHGKISRDVVRRLANLRLRLSESA